MKQVWKFVLEPGRAIQEVKLPMRAEIMTAREQRETVCVWALVDPAEPPETRRFEVVGTGWTLPKRQRSFIGTALLDGGALVFHVFEVTGH